MKLLSRTWSRRLVSVPVVLVGAVVTTVLLPVLILLTLIVDAWRAKGLIVTRAVGFLWAYLIGEVWAVLSLGITGLLPRPARIRTAYALQAAWVAWNYHAVRILFGMRFAMEGESVGDHGPVVVLCRHASLIDTLLPARALPGLRLRYVLKKELLVDPALDIAGNRLPNVFVDRRPEVSADERRAVRALATGLDEDEGVLIYPEGTRFTERKRDSAAARLATRDDEIGRIAAGLRQVLPPRPGGTLAILDATDAPVVVLGHHGLEGLASVEDVLAGGLIGITVTIRLWSIPRSEIPDDRAGRVEWLYETWTVLDEWLAGFERPAS